MVIINRGKAVIEGSVQDLLNNGRLKVTIETSEVARAQQILRESSVGNHLQSVTQGELIIMLERHEIAGVVQLLTSQNIPLSAVTPVRSLEEYFISLTQEVV
jgi:ABC-2 type transport system ATP-binding protein